MRKAMLTLLLGLASASAAADWAKWIFVDRQETFIIYADAATIRTNGKLARMWDMADARTGKALAGVKQSRSFKMEREYDCSTRQLRLLYISWYSGNMGEGQIVGSDSTEGSWRAALPGTEGEILWKIACGAERGRGL